MTQTETLEKSLSKATALEAAIIETNPAKMIVLNYDKALAALHRAVKAIERNDIEARCNNVNEAIDTITELYLSLDFTKSTELAENLSTMYSYMIWQLPKVNFDNDAAVALEVTRYLKQLRRSWVQLASLTDSDGTLDEEALNELVTTRATEEAPYVA